MTERVTPVVGANPEVVEQLMLAFAEIWGVLGQALTPVIEAIIPIVQAFGDIIAGLMPILYWIVTQFRTGDSLSTILFEYSNPYQIKDLLHTILVNASHLFTDIGPLYLTGILCIWGASLWIRYKRKEKISAVSLGEAEKIGKKIENVISNRFRFGFKGYFS